MERTNIEGQSFNKISFKATGEKFEYDQCHFINCDFTGADLSEIRFIDSEFEGCNLSNCKLIKTSFQGATFRQCKLMGLLFDQCNPIGFSATFEGCQLDHSSFYKMKLQKTRFNECRLEGVDFTLADLRESVITSCDLKDTTFSETNLEKADLSQSANYSIDPDNNRIKGAVFSIPEVLGLLSKYQISIK